MAFYAQVRKSDNGVISLHMLDPALAAKFSPTLPTVLIEITEVQYNAVNGKLFHDGSNFHQFKWAPPNFDLVADPRPTVTFTPARVKAEIGELVTVKVDHSGGADGLREFFLAGEPTRMDFVVGTAPAVVIDTSRAVDFVIAGQQGFQVAAPLHVTVFSRKIGPSA